MDMDQIVHAYAIGPQLLRDAVAGLSADQMCERPIEGTWSTLEVLCHLADFEIVYAHRIQLMICQEEPALFDLNQNLVAEKLFYDKRNPQTQLDLIAAIRQQMTNIISQLLAEQFQRGGVHDLEGRLTVLSILERITRHIPHHVEFLHQKRMAILGE